MSQVSGDVFEDINNFHDRYLFSPDKLTIKGMINRLQFLEEELFETEKALYSVNSEEVLDGLIDLMVVAAGTINLMFGRYAGKSAWIKVMNANNQKVLGFNKSRPNSDGMDLVKPEGWHAPALHVESILLRDKLTKEFDGKDITEMRHLMEKSLMIMEKSLMMQFAWSQTAEKTPEEKLLDCINERPAVVILEDAADVIRSKSQDYANPDSSVKAADYYPNGVDDFVYMIDVLKRNRMTSLLETLKKRGETYTPNNEDLRDTLIDRINYLALMVEWLDGNTPGQAPDRDAFNRPLPEGDLCA